jgi:acyl-CoA thioester hydrolase
MEIDFEHSTKLRVRYGETDQMGYCYYGNYAQYFEVGRVEAMRQVGMSYKDLEKQSVMLPVSEFQVKYVVAALYDDVLTVVTKITNLNGVRLYFEYEIFNEQRALVCKASTTLVFVSKETMKPIQPPEKFTSLISKYAK